MTAAEARRAARAHERLMARHSAELKGVLFAVSVLRSLRDRANAAHDGGDAGAQRFYLNGVLNAVDSLLDKHPRVDELRACDRCVATGRVDGERCFLCEGKGERVLGSSWPDIKGEASAETPE